MTALCFDRELIERYDRSGPRYTSYPTAVQFHTGFGEAAYREVALARRAIAGADPLSLYVHLPFCTSPCFYCACNRIITRSEDRGAAYLLRLYREIEMQAALFGAGRTVEQLHFGGGTPTFFSLAQLERLMVELRTHFELTDSATREYSIEIDPRTVTPASVASLAQLGLNRMSLGIQDFDEAVQRAVNRVQSASDTLLLVEAAREAGVESISFDLIYGLPRQTLGGFERTLQTVLKARPDRIAAYAYAHMPHVFKAQRRLSAEQLPSPAARLDLLGLTIEMLTSAGYEYIGMDHFALPNDDLARAKRERTLHRNFQGYSTHALYDLVALGVSAIGKVGHSYAQNYKQLPEYYAAIDAGRLPIHRGIRLTQDDRIRAAVIQELMCHERCEFAPIATAFGIEFGRYFAQELEQLRTFESDGLVSLTPQMIEITSRGRMLTRNVAMVFDAYLQPRAAESLYSRVI
ncbi:MAG TPA: oxygen-independent coproporphyrinogen III oxidase [Steroidobacteraceae bacterium]|nr:oxygen-independent coproporphyrinogen III oxidase [Steroidobacteraceae bacterium]